MMTAGEGGARRPRVATRPPPERSRKAARLRIEDWSIVEHRGLAGLDRIEGDWRRLYLASPLRGGDQALSVYRAYLEHLCPAPDEFRFLALTRDGATRAICPLEARTDRSTGMPVAAWGSPKHREWLLADVVGPEDDARGALLPAVVEHLRRAEDRRPALVLGPLPESSVLWEGLAGLDAAGYCAHGEGACDVLDCTLTLDATSARHATNSRRSMASDS